MNEIPSIGHEVIKAALASLPLKPGVYRMINAAGEVLYVGKAKQLKQRVTHYTLLGQLNTRLLRMVQQVARLEHTITRNEAEALLLEAQQIKTLKPRYNILLRDDKSFPYICIEADHPFPRITKHRGAQKKGHRYIGPFPSAGAVNEALAILQKAFLLRPCPDSIFENRSRPCLQYQIKRCSAPCVGYISETEYGEAITQATAFLKGQCHDIQQQLAIQMQAHSDAQDYEKAAALRDRIRALSTLQHEQRLHAAALGDADLMAIALCEGQSCVRVRLVRGGLHFGSLSYFPRHETDAAPADILSAFIGQYYQTHEVPSELYLSLSLPDSAVLQEALGLMAERPITLYHPQRGEKKNLMSQIEAEAQEQLRQHLQARQSERALLQLVADRFDLEAPPARIEIYDNSHIMGSHALGAMVVATPQGFDKASYRRFDMKDAPKGDDYAMMRAMFLRRFGRLQREDPDRAHGQWPDLVLIDGGAGQLGVVRDLLAELGISDVPLVAIAKGVDRYAGRETFFMADRQPFMLPPNDALLHYLQRLRDEAHRFAIGSHRTKRAKILSHSALDEVPGIGAARKRALLHHFGSKAAVEKADLSELENVPGISKTIAKTLYDYFHS